MGDRTHRESYPETWLICCVEGPFFERMARSSVMGVGCEGEGGGRSALVLFRMRAECSVISEAHPLIQRKTGYEEKRIMYPGIIAHLIG